MHDREKHPAATGIIGGADGPTGICLLREASPSLRRRLQRALYACRRRYVERRITAAPHTL